METITVSLRNIEYVPQLERPVFRNRKDWRRYQVALKRMQGRIDRHIMQAMFGSDFEPSQPAWPPRREPRKSFLTLASMS